MFEKHLTVKFAGIEGMKSITIKGEVIADPNAASAPAAAPATEPKKEVVAEKTATPAKKVPAKKAAAPATKKP
jgi:hypothetical protein